MLQASFRYISHLLFFKMFFIASILEWCHHACHHLWCHDVAPPRTPSNDQSLVGCNKIHDSKFSTICILVMCFVMIFSSYGVVHTSNGVCQLTMYVNFKKVRINKGIFLLQERNVKLHNLPYTKRPRLVRLTWPYTP